MLLYLIHNKVKYRIQYTIQFYNAELWYATIHIIIIGTQYLTIKNYILQYFALLYYSKLLHCTILHDRATYFKILSYISLWCTILQSTIEDKCTTLYYKELQHR